MELVRRVFKDEGQEKASSELIEYSEVLRMAEEEGLDVITLGRGSDGYDIVTLGDYQKFLYEKKKKEKKNRAVNRQDLKEVRMDFGICAHDIKCKAATASRILKEGDKIKISVRFKGRSVTQIRLGKDVIEHLIKDITTPFKIERSLTTDGNRVFLILAPHK